MMREIRELPDESATQALGRELAGRLTRGTVYLNGTLGAGKTTLVRAWLRALGHEGAVRSPTYTLVEPYEIGGCDVYHFDLYRLADPEELELIGGRDYFDNQALCLVEWPEKGAGMLPPADLVIDLAVKGQGRAATLTFSGDFSPTHVNESQ